MKSVFILIFSLCFLNALQSQVDSNRVISGSLRCFNYWPMSGQIVVLTDTLSGEAQEQAVDSSGFFSFQNVPTGKTYKLSLKNEQPPLDTFRAVSVLDLVKMSQHILAIRPLSDLGAKAADMNDSFGVTTFDMVMASRALLGKGDKNVPIRWASILSGNGSIYSHNLIQNFNSSLWGLQLVYFIKGDVDGSGCN